MKEFVGDDSEMSLKFGKDAWEIYFNCQYTPIFNTHTTLPDSKHSKTQFPMTWNMKIKSVISKNRVTTSVVVLLCNIELYILKWD